MKSTKLLKKLFATMLLITMLFTMTGCLFQFDASRYTKACLDLMTKGETADYTEMTKQTKEEAEDWYNSFLDKEIEAMTSSISNMTEEQEQNFRSLFQSIYKKANYTVGEATRNDDKSYSVPITIQQYKIFSGEMQVVEDQLVDYYKEQIEAGKTLSEDDLTQKAVDILYEDLTAKLETAEYGEAEEFTVIVRPNSENVYSIDQNDYTTIVKKLFDIDELN
ncbi:MAG: hypothetical protein PUC39_08025 [Lachnospiraceae bacterium]|nr:hypothetical protein [Lachnospiraceae bacterium]